MYGQGVGNLPEYMSGSGCRTDTVKPSPYTVSASCRADVVPRVCRMCAEFSARDTEADVTPAISRSAPEKIQRNGFLKDVEVLNFKHKKKHFRAITLRGVS